MQNNLKHTTDAQLMTPSKDKGPVQIIGLNTQEEVEIIIEDMKEHMAAIAPEIDYVGNGEDGCVFDIDGRNVIKLLFPVMTWDAAHEAYALQILNEASSPISPKLEDVGHIGPYRAIIREDLNDMNGHTSEFKYGSVIEFIEEMPREIRYLLNKNPDMDRSEVIQQKICEFVDTYYEGDPELKANELETNPLLSSDFIQGLCDAHEIMSNNNISMLDISEVNLGLGRMGNACLRDLSRFIGPSVPEVDFSKDVTSKVLELVEGYKNRMAKTNEATKGLEPGL